MVDEVRMWEVGNDDKLTEVGRSKLDLEARIQTWVAADISVLDPKLLVIGKEVETAFGKFIDLLCMDCDGNLVIVELKRDKTPREVVAQALDYGSWVKNLEAEKIREIAANYFKGCGTKETGADLESAFRIKFKTEFSELEIVNEHHAIRIVATEIDDSTERIIRYLSESYGVDINALRFQFFQAADGHQMLARTFTVAAEEAAVNIRKRPGKRNPYATPAELEKTAEQAGVGNLYRRFEQGLKLHFAAGTTTSSRIFSATIGDSRLVIFSLLPSLSSADKGLRYQLYSKRLAHLLHVDENAIRAELPPIPEDWKWGPSAPPEMYGCAGYIKTEAEIQKIMDFITQRMRDAVSA